MAISPATHTLLELLGRDHAVSARLDHMPPYLRTVLAVGRFIDVAQKSKGRYQLFAEPTAEGGSLVLEINPELVGELVQQVLNVGDALLFGVTRDGGSIRVILMSGDEKVSHYLSDARSFDDFAKRVTQHLRDTYS